MDFYETLYYFRDQGFLFFLLFIDVTSGLHVGAAQAQSTYNFIKITCFVTATKSAKNSYIFIYF